MKHISNLRIIWHSVTECWIQSTMTKYAPNPFIPMVRFPDFTPETLKMTTLFPNRIDECATKTH